MSSSAAKFGEYDQIFDTEFVLWKRIARIALRILHTHMWSIFNTTLSSKQKLFSSLGKKQQSSYKMQNSATFKAFNVHVKFLTTCKC